MKGIIKDSLILFAITLISGFILGFVHDITQEPIARQKEKEKAAACAEVFEQAASFSAVELSEEFLQENSYAKGDVDEILYALDESGNVIGYVITVTSHEGYGGDITFMTGIRSDGTVNGISITDISETAGLGMKAKEESFRSQFADKNVESFAYTKSGASADNEIDALSGATITTNAMTNGVNGALNAFRAVTELENGGVR
jgi:electron transport complex protein RnfG